MATIDRSLLRSGFDVEAVFTGRYLQGLLTAAYDAGVISSTYPIDSDPDPVTGEVTLLDTAIVWQPSAVERLYEPTVVQLSDTVTAADWPVPHQFVTEILVDDPSNAKLRVEVDAGTLSVPLPAPFVALLDVQLVSSSADGALTDVGLALELLDIETDDGTWSTLADHGVTHDRLVAKVAPRLNRVVDIGAIAKGQRVEEVQIRWLPAGDADQNVLGVYLNLHLRDTDAPGHHVTARGDTAAAVNFLPSGQDVAMATRDGLYGDARNDTWSRLASPHGSEFEHPLRKSLLDPDSERVGDVNDIRIGRIPPQPGPGGGLFPQNGLRLQIDAHYDATAPATTDLTMTLDLRPVVDSDGLLQWDTDLGVDVDAVFEFFTGWIVALAAITFGPIGAGIALGAVVATEIGAGVYLGEHFDSKVHDRADATLSDVIPDRLAVATVRWDPFYATKHQVVVEAAQAEFGDQGFSLCGTVVVGRELVPPVDTVLQHPVRDADGALTGLAYRIPGSVEVDDHGAIVTAPGTHRRDFTTPDPASPDVYPLTLDQVRARRDDPDGPLVLTHLPYFPAAVHVVEHQIAHLMGIAASQLSTVRDRLRAAWKQQRFDQIEHDDGADIRAQVVTDLSAGGATPTDDEIDAEVEARIQAVVDEQADADFRAPAPLDMVFDPAVRPELSFDLTPKEWIVVRDEQLVDLDPSVRAVRGRRVVDYVRDDPDPGPHGFTHDNLLERPRYTPGPDGPVFRD